MGIRGKLLWGYMFIALVTASVAFLSFRATSWLDRAFEDVSKQTLPVIDALHDLRYFGTRVVVTASELALLMSKSNAENPPPMQQEEELELEQSFEQYKQAFLRYRDLVSLRSQARDVELLDMIEATSQRLQTLLRELIGLEAQRASADVMLEKIQEIEVYETTFVYAVDGALAFELEQFEAHQENVRSAIDQTQNVAAVFGPVSILATVLVVIYVSRSILRALVSLKNASLALGAGNWDARMPLMSKDELGDVARTFNKMAAKLKSKNNEIMAAKSCFDGIMENIPEPLIITEPNGAISSVNNAALSILRYTPRELKGRSIVDISVKNQLHSISDKWIEKLKSGAAIRQTETHFISKDGRAIPVFITAAPMKNEKGAVFSVIYAGQIIDYSHHDVASGGS